MKIEKIQNKLFGKTQIPDVFIREYMPGLPPAAVKLYIYLVYASENSIECTEESLAMILGSDVSVVNENIILLESTGLILWQNDAIILCDIIQKEVERNYRLRTVARPDDLLESDREKHYARSKVQKAISDKFFSGQMPISWYNEIDLWFDKYGFDPDVVFMLFQHCANNGVITKPYIRKVAESWGGKYHIRTPEQLDEYLKSYESYKSLRTEVLKRLKWRRNMNVYEEEIVEKWFYTYKYDIEIIEIALKKSVSKNSATLATFDSIITSWYKSGLTNKDEILKYEEERRSAYIAAKAGAQNTGGAASNAAGGANTAHGGTGTTQGGARQKDNFKQRSYDEDYLNSLYVNGDGEQ